MPDGRDDRGSLRNLGTRESTTRPNLHGFAHVTNHRDLLAVAGKLRESVGGIIDVDDDDVGAVGGQLVAVGASDSAPAASDNCCLSLKSHVVSLVRCGSIFCRRRSRTATWPLVPQRTGRGHVSQKSVIAAGVHAGDDRVEPFSDLIWADDVDEPLAFDAGLRH
jgi:hypothetical protein